MRERKKLLPQKLIWYHGIMGIIYTYSVCVQLAIQTKSYTLCRIRLTGVNVYRYLLQIMTLNWSSNRQMNVRFLCATVFRSILSSETHENSNFQPKSNISVHKIRYKKLILFLVFIKRTRCVIEICLSYGAALPMQLNETKCHTHLLCWTATTHWLKRQKKKKKTCRLCQRGGSTSNLQCRYDIWLRYFRSDKHKTEFNLSNIQKTI